MQTKQSPYCTEYLRRSPAVLAADPTVLAMIGAAYLRAEIAVGTVDPQNEDDATAQQIAEVEAIRLLTPADALAALERVRREARNEALEEVMKAVSVTRWSPYTSGSAECRAWIEGATGAVKMVEDAIRSMKEPTERTTPPE
jgi:hypothetical protein